AKRRRRGVGGAGVCPGCVAGAVVAGAGGSARGVGRGGAPFATAAGSLPVALCGRHGVARDRGGAGAACGQRENAFISRVADGTRKIEGPTMNRGENSHELLVEKALVGFDLAA